MTRLHRVPSDFATPKVRDSFVSKFVYDTEEDQVTTYFIYSHLSEKMLHIKRVRTNFFPYKQ